MSEESERAALQAYAEAAAALEDATVAADRAREALEGAHGEAIDIEHTQLPVVVELPDGRAVTISVVREEYNWHLEYVIGHAL